MAHDAPPPLSTGKTVIRNIGLLLSGAIETPILDADAIVAVDGRIAASAARRPRRSRARRPSSTPRA